MALIIEDGSGVEGAEAYSDADAYEAWHVAFHGAASGANVTAVEAAIRRAVSYLDSLPWMGFRTHGGAQAHAWPRTDVVDCDGNPVGPAEIPAALASAQHALTRAEIANPDCLAPTVAGGTQKELVGLDSLKWEITSSPTEIDRNRAVVLPALDAIRCMLVRDPTRSGGTYPLLRA